ncbi:MAG: NADPH-dependent FMN reductase [Acidimicrobiales bacterium]
MTPTTGPGRFGADEAGRHPAAGGADVHRILLIPGSLRRRSTNVAVLRTVQLVAPEDTAAVLFTGLGELPPFNPDDDEDPLDPTVADLRAQIRAADGIVFSTPEYAGALPGAFKNLLDWTVGDDRPGSIYEKPVGWVNASPRGAPNAHESLRRVLGYVKATIVEPACLHIPVTADMLDDELIADPSIRARLADALAALDARITRGGSHPSGH